jgi:hypothetical protein
LLQLLDPQGFLVNAGLYLHERVSHTPSVFWRGYRRAEGTISTRRSRREK